MRASITFLRTNCVTSSYDSPASKNKTPPNRLRAAPRYKAAASLSSRGLIHTPETEVRYHGGTNPAKV